MSGSSSKRLEMKSRMDKATAKKEKLAKSLRRNLAKRKSQIQKRKESIRDVS